MGVRMEFNCQYHICENYSCELKDRCFRNVTNYEKEKVPTELLFRASPYRGICYYYMPLDKTEDYGFLSQTY
jgi:hypothetical protein